LLQTANVIICADGGAEHARNLDVFPDYIIGDLDSIKKQTIAFFNNLGKTKIIENPDQNKTDLELAIDLAASLNPKTITIFGAIGNRMDHTLANIFCLTTIDPAITSRIIDDCNTIELVRDNQTFSGEMNEIISIIPLTDISQLMYTGLKWNLDKVDTNLGWFGISNRFKEETASISCSKGLLLVIKVRNTVD